MKLEELKVETNHLVEELEENFTAQVEEHIQEVNDEHARQEGYCL